ncbi:MAG: protease modulator HflC [Lentisphaeria bacterium]|nr:protease modulator HflC [Lentisphaeria bacterium]MBR2642856.1 protease modulator HflC [Lentisphaeria bacterium]
MATSKFFQHLPTVLLGIVVAVVLLLVLVTFQVSETECAVMTTLGNIEKKADLKPGLHFRWPYPFQRVYKFDRRLRCFEGNAGKLEETSTSDEQNILVGIFVEYRIADAEKFFVSLERVSEAEQRLNNWMRAARNATFGRYRFNQIVNVDAKEVKLAQIQKEMLDEIRRNAAPFGLEVEAVGINAFNMPSTISEEVFKRMIQERKSAAEKFLSTGALEAGKIRTAADKAKADLLTEAEAKAKTIRAEGDAEAARYYEVFKANPELAAFLRKLDSLRRIMQSRTTLVLDTGAAPFDLLNADAAKLGPRAR